MKVLIIPSWYPPQGGDFFKTQAESISRIGHNVGVIYLEEYSIKNIFNFSIKSGIFKIRKSNENGLNVIRLAWIRFPFFERLNLHFRIPLYKLLFKKHIQHFGLPDIMHAHSSLWGGYFAYKLKLKYNIPYTITEHRGRFNIRNRLLDSYFDKWFFSYLNKSLSYSNKIICVTKYQIEGLKAFAPAINDSRFVVIPNIFESDFLNEKIVLKDYSSKMITFLNIAIFFPYKNQILLLEAINRLIKSGQKNIKLFMAGDGPLKPECEEYVKKEGLESYCEFLGYCNKSQIIKFLNECDYMVLSSLSEGQPVSILESFSMGKPVIVPDIISDDIVNESNGIIFKTGDLESLIVAIQKVLNSQIKYNPDELRRYASEGFSEKTIIPKIIEVYSDILNHYK